MKRVLSTSGKRLKRLDEETYGLKCCIDRRNSPCRRNAENTALAPWWKNASLRAVFIRSVLTVPMIGPEDPVSLLQGEAPEAVPPYD